MTMEGGGSKAQSSWLDSHISPENSTWLEENIEGPEHSVKEELVSLKTKLQNLEKENTILRHEVHENILVTMLASNLQYQLDSVQHDIKTQNALLETEKNNVFELQKQVFELQKVICDFNTKIRTMEEESNASREKLKTAEDEITKLKHEPLNKISEETHQLTTDE